jgi:hypothetical protein
MLVVLRMLNYLAIKIFYLLRGDPITHLLSQMFTKYERQLLIEIKNKQQGSALSGM